MVEEKKVSEEEKIRFAEITHNMSKEEKIGFAKKMQNMSEAGKKKFHEKIACFGKWQGTDKMIRLFGKFARVLGRREDGKEKYFWSPKNAAFFLEPYDEAKSDDIAKRIPEFTSKDTKGLKYKDYELIVIPEATTFRLPGEKKKTKMIYDKELTVTSLGRRFDRVKRKYTDPRPGQRGYCYIKHDNKLRGMHQLVVKFFGTGDVPPGNDTTPDHINNAQPWLNIIDNLRYATQKVQKENRADYEQPAKWKPVYGRVSSDKNAEWILYESLQDAASKTGTHATHISACCNKRRKKANDYEWKYAEEDGELKEGEGEKKGLANYSTKNDKDHWLKVTSLGRVWNNVSKRWTYTTPNKNHDNKRSAHTNKGKLVFIDRSVLLAFCGPPPGPPDKYCAHHKDGDNSNDHIDNLEWKRSNPPTPVWYCALEHCNDPSRRTVKEEGVTKAAKELGICRQSVSDVLRGKNKRAWSERDKKWYVFGYVRSDAPQSFGKASPKLSSSSAPPASESDDKSEKEDSAALDQAAVQATATASATVGEPGLSSLGEPGPSSLGEPGPSSLGEPRPSSLGEPGPSSLGNPGPSSVRDPRSQPDDERPMKKHKEK